MQRSRKDGGHMRDCPSVCWKSAFNLRLCGFRGLECATDCCGEVGFRGSRGGYCARKIFAMCARHLSFILIAHCVCRSFVLNFYSTFNAIAGILWALLYAIYCIPFLTPVHQKCNSCFADSLTFPGYLNATSALNLWSGKRRERKSALKCIFN